MAQAVSLDMNANPLSAEKAVCLGLTVKFPCSNARPPLGIG